MAIPHNRPASVDPSPIGFWLISSRHPADRRVEGADSASIAESILMVNVPIKPKGYVYHVMILLFG